MKRLMTLLVVLTLLVTAGCDKHKSDADEKQAQATKSRMDEAFAQVGMPAIVNFKELKDAKMIAELRDQENLVCYAYLYNQMKGELVFIGKCLDYGLPYSVQMTNPERTVHRQTYGGGSFGTLPQAEPNGLFMPEGLSATWLMMIDENGEARPVYVEPQILVSPFPLHKVDL